MIIALQIGVKGSRYAADKPEDHHISLTKARFQPMSPRACTPEPTTLMPYSRTFSSLMTTGYSALHKQRYVVQATTHQQLQQQ